MFCSKDRLVNDEMKMKNITHFLNDSIKSSFSVRINSLFLRTFVYAQTIAIQFSFFSLNI